MTKNPRVLIGYDGSDCAEAALDDLSKAGLPADAEAIVISVAEEWMPLPPPSSYELFVSDYHPGLDQQTLMDWSTRAVEEAEHLAARGAERLQVHFPKWRVSAEALSGSPATRLIERAESWPADLIIVGSHGRSALGRFFLGSVSQKVVTESHCSVRVARGKIEEGDSRTRVIIAFDGSEGANAALDTVTGRCWPDGSQARIVSVMNLLSPAAVEYVRPASKGDRTYIEEIVDSAKQKLQKTTLDVSAVILEADPRRTIVEEAERWGADCIFVGARAMGRLERFLLGSVSAAVTARAHCSVEVVRA